MHRLMKTLGSATPVIALTALWLLSGTALHAAIEYDAALDAYCITDFPEGWPCTPKQLADIDRLLGLEKMSRDMESGAWILNCHLLIGAQNGRDTYFQIGAPGQRTNETLVLRGSLYVAPYHVDGESPHQRWWYGPAYVNRLMLGAEEHPEVHAKLLFAASASGTVGALVVGGRREADGRTTRGRGGQFMAWNSLVTAATNAPGFEIDSVNLTGDGFVFVNSTLSRVKGMMTYGLLEGWRKTIRVEDSTFAHGGKAVVGGTQRYRNCRFRDNHTAVLDYGSIDVLFEGCVFENNRHNWELRFPAETPGTVTLVDCEIGLPLNKNLMRIVESQSVRALRIQGVALHMPRVLIKRHVVVLVRDASGRPVPKAKIAMRAEQPDSGLDEGLRYITDHDGRTPGRDQHNAILLTQERRRVVEDDPNGASDYWTYTLTAESGDRHGEVSGIAPTQSWQEVSVTIR